MTTSKIQMDQIRSTSATVTGENIRAGSQKKSSLSPAEGLQGASPDATCTCPSGDGSLRHPCPAHPAPVEQAGGDERVIGWRERILAAHPNSDPGFWPDALLVQHMAAEIADLRAALAQPSPAPADEKPGDSILCSGCFAKGVGPEHFDEAGKCLARQQTDPLGLAQHAKAFNEVHAEALRPEQAEAERPEVVGSLYLGGWADQEELEDNDVELDMKVVERLQVDLASKGDGVHMPLMTVAQHERIVGDLQRQKHEADTALAWATRHYQTVEQERDSALARVAELELKLDQSDYAYDNDRHHMRGMAKQAAEAIQVFTGHDSGANLAHRYGEKWWEHLDELRDALLAFAKNAPPARAQHSVPEGWRIERSAERIVVMNLNNGAGYAAARNGESGIAESVLYLLAADLLAAAPGKEGNDD